MMMQHETYVTEAGDHVTPQMIVQDLKSQDPETQMKAVRAARSILCVEDPPVTPLVDAGIIPPLVEALDRYDSPNYQYRALGVLSNIAFGSSEYTLAVINSGAIPKVISFLSCEGDLSERAVLTLGNFALHGAEARRLVLSHGLVSHMLPYMRSDTPSWQLKTFVRAFSNFCSYNPEEAAEELEFISPALPYLSDLLDFDSGEQDVLVDACTALANIMQGSNEGIEAVQAVSDLTARLVALLGHAAANVTRAALGAVANMLGGTQIQVDRCLEANCLDHILTFLGSRDFSLVEAACRAAANIFAGSHTHIQKALGKNMLFLLRNILLRNEDRCQKQAVHAITNLCCNGSAAQYCLVLCCGLLYAYCALLGSSDQALAEDVLCGLYHLIQAAERDDHVKPLCYELDELEVLDKLQQLQEQITEENHLMKILYVRETIRKYAREERSVIQDGKKFTSAEIGEDLNSQDPSTKLKAARATFTLLNEKFPAVNALLEAGILTRLSEILDGSNSPHLLQVAASWAIVITGGTRKHRIAVIESGAVPKLVALLSYGGVLAEVAAMALGNLALHGPEARDAMLAYVETEEGLTGMRHYVLTYRNCCREVAGQPMSNLSRVILAVPFVCEILDVKDHIILEHACWALADLTSGSAEVVETIQTTLPQLTTRLVALLGHETAAVKEPALMAVGNMVLRAGPQTERCLDAGCLDHIISILQSREYSLVQKATRAVFHILRGSSSQIQRALDKDILTPLRNILVDGEDECRKQAGKAITCLCVNGSAAQREVLLSSGVLEPFCALLTASDAALVDCVLNGLHPFVKAAEKDGNLKMFCSKLDEIGVIEQLQRLQELEIGEVNRNNANLLSVILRRHSRGEHLVISNKEIVTLADIVQGVKSQDIKAQTRAMKAAYDMLRYQESSDTAMAQAGLVPFFVATLDKHDGTDLQRHAVWALKLITFAKREITTTAINNEAIPKVIALLNRGVEVPGAACGILSNIVRKHLDVGELALESGALQAMLPYMRPDSRHLEQMKHILQACNILCQFQTNLELVSPVLPYIHDLLSVDREDVLEKACHIITALLDAPSREERVAAILAVSGLTARVVTLLSHDSLNVQSAALGVVGNMVSGTDSQKQRIIELDIVTPLIRMLDEQPNYDLKYYSTLTLRNISASRRREHIDAFVEKGVIPKLISLFTHEDLVVIEAAFTLANITLHGTHYRDLVLERGVVPAMRHQMRPDKPVEVLRACTLAYSFFCRQDDDHMVKFELVSPGLPYTYKLLEHKDEEVLARACSALANLLSSTQHIEAVQAVPELTARLVALMGHKANAVKQAALTAVANMFCGNITQVERCLNANCLEYIASLLESDDPSLVMKSILATDKLSFVIHRDIIIPLRLDGQQDRNETRPIAARAVDRSCGIQTTYSSTLYFKERKALTDFTTGSRHYSEAIVNSGVIPRLVALLSRGGNVTEAAATTLGNVAVHALEARDMVRASGVVRAMVPYMRPDTHLRQLRIYVRTYYSLVRHSMVEVDFALPVLPYLLELLKMTDSIVLENTCLILGNLILGPDEDIKEAIVTLPGLTDRAIELMGHKAIAVKIASLSFVVNVLSMANALADSCLSDSCLEHIVTFLRSGHPSLVEYAVQGTTNIFSKHFVDIQRALDKDILTPLADILAHGNKQYQKPAAVAILNLCCKGTAFQTELVTSERVLRPYCALLASPDQSLVWFVLEGLQVLLMNAAKAGNLRNLCFKYVEMGVLDHMQTLRQHKIDEKLHYKTVLLSDNILSNIESGHSKKKELSTVAAIIQGLQSQDLEKKDAAALAVRRFLISLDLSNSDCGITEVIALLSAALDSAGCGSQLQYGAVGLINAITKESSENSKAVVESGAVPKLISVVSNGGVATANALWALGNIACSGPDLRDEILAQGLVEAMIPHLDLNTPLPLLRRCAWTFEALCCHDDESPEKLKCLSPALPQISEILLNIEDEYVLEQACWGLVMLLDTNEGIDMLQAVDGLTAAIVGLLAHAAGEVKRVAINCLVRLFTGTETQVKKCLDAGCLKHMVSLLRCDEPRLVDLTLQATSNMLRFTHSRSDRALEQSLLTALLDLLTDAEPNSPRLSYAINALANFTDSGTRAQKLAVVNGGAIPKIVALLSQEASVSASAVYTLGLLAEVRAKTRDLVLHHGAVAAMLPLLRGDTPVTLLTSCVVAYWKYCRNDSDKPPVKLDFVSPALPHISELLCIDNENVLDYACRSLICLMGTSEGIEAVQAVEGLTARLGALLVHKANAVKNVSVMAIIFMLSGTDAQVDRCLQAGCAEHMVSYLQDRDPELTEEAREAIKNTLGETHPLTEKILGQEPLTPLMTLLACSARGQQSTLQAISNLFRRATTTQRGQLVSNGVLGPYCALLAGTDRALIKNVLDSIEVLLQVSMNDDNLKPFCSNLTEMGILDQMKRLLDNENEEINKKVQHLIDTYFT